MARVEMPALDVRVVPGGRGRGPGIVEVPRHQLAERESEAIATGVVLLQGLDRALAAVADLNELHDHVTEYLEACRRRAALIDPRRTP